jgi:hypothetical protein
MRKAKSVKMMTDLFEMSAGDRVEHQMMLDTFIGWDDEHALKIKKITQDRDSASVNAEQNRKACDGAGARSQSRKDNREMEIMVSKFKRENESRAYSLNSKRSFQDVVDLLHVTKWS